MRSITTQLVLVSAMLVLAGCGGGGEGDGDSNTTPPVANNPAPTTPPPSPTPDPNPTPPPGDDPAPPAPPPAPPAHKNLFATVSGDTWDETAVRKVLHIFAFGGHTSDAQIATWADMAPEDAIEQMLTFDQHNLALSTPALGDVDGLGYRPATLHDLAAFWSSNDPGNLTPIDSRHIYDVDNFNGWAPALWQRAATTRGLNPFRHKIGMWETNYHMAVNIKSGVGQTPLLRYYEDIMQAHLDGLPYQQVMATAASSAAIALQYGHRNNRYSNGVCDCNEDFAREYHQLFFGILGMGEMDYHETVTIKNTAKAFTDMTVHWDELNGITDWVDFGTFYHPDQSLEILGTMVDGTTAEDRIAALAEVSINHPESLDNLPVMIVNQLADDNLTSLKISAIRNAWSSMDEKNLLTFLRGYAISNIFHDESRVKYLTSVDRHMLITNQVVQNNLQNDIGVYAPRPMDEGVNVFAPTHNVFGSQKGTEAASSDRVFREAYNRATERVWQLRSSEGEKFGTSWERDWAALAPRNDAGNFVVEDVAEWLWQRFIADGLKNFGPLEQAHLYALLGGDRDLAYLLDENNLDRVVTKNDVLFDTSVIELVNDMKSRILLLDSVVEDDRRSANQRIGTAINFIIATPYMFAQEGR
ncbi:MAG: DUF1800 family protein [Gammaproteobacteria bacterium]|nr:DUF1800 family protein [Gammaproteobacteria bacterium]